MLELKRLSVDDELEVYKMLQKIPGEENGLLNKANGLTLRSSFNERNAAEMLYFFYFLELFNLI